MGHALVLLLPFVLTLLASAATPLSLTVRPRKGFAPVDLHLIVHVERHPTNRILCFQAMSDRGIATSSCRDLEGERAPMTHQQWFKSLPPGEYEAQAYVIRAGEASVSTSRISFTVMGDDF